MKYQQQIEAYVAEHEQLLLDSVCRLVRIRSVKEDAAPGMPFGPGPAAALAEALKVAGEWGLNPINHENYVGTADLNDKETALHILGHLDVVNEGTGWTVTEPYEPKLVDGLLYGRGTDDDKGPVVTALLALKCIKDLGIPMKSNARVIMGTDEESGSADLDYYFARNPHAPYSFTPDSSFPVTNVEKGTWRPSFTKNWPESAELPRLAWLHGGIRFNVLPSDADCAVEGLSVADIRPIADEATKETGVNFTLSQQEGLTHIAAKGVSSHAAYPHAGVNAITGLLTLLGKLPLKGGAAQAIADLNELFPHGDCWGKALGVAQEDEISKQLTIAFSLLEFTSTGMEGRFDCRYPVCVTEENCMKVAEAAFAARDMATSNIYKYNPPHHTPAESPFVQTLLRCYENYSGLEGECLASGGGTYVHNIPGGVAFGARLPDFDSHLHSPDERVRVSDLLLSVKIFAQVIVELCGA